MIGRLVITSVERGLGAGPGFQPVLRTRGMRPAVAERLRLRSGYPHPYPFGDRRNPEVFFHRIESVAGQRLHVLARVGDAGSDYSGRSNRISDLLVLDDADCRRLPAGPVFAAAGFSWIRAWSSAPRETDEAIDVPGADPSDSVSADCGTWAAITGDAGWAGELAKSCVDGRSALVVARQGDDVLRLFGEAIRLLPPDVRWNVTFNTCEIEPFAASWRAIRSDITRTPGKPDGTTLRIDLETIARTKGRAADHAYVTFARGEGPAPWQANRADVPLVDVPPRPPTSGTRSNGADRPMGGPPEDVGAEIRRRRQRRLARTAAAGGDDSTVGNSRHVIRTSVWVVMSLVTIGMVLTVVIWFVGNPQKLLAMLPRRGALQDAGHGAVVELETPEQKHARAVRKEEQRTLEAAAEIERQKRDQEEKDRENRATAEAEQRAEAEKAAKLSREKAESVEAEKKRRRERIAAITEFQRLPTEVSIVPTGSTLAPGGEFGLEEVDFAPYPVDRLVQPAFSVAYPESRIDGVPLALRIEPVDRRGYGDPTWNVLADVPRKFEPFEGKTDERRTETQHICSFVARGGHLWMAWQPGVTASYPAVRLLRNSVLIASCRHPEDDTTCEQAIYLAKPLLCQSIPHEPLDDIQSDLALDFDGRLQDVPSDAVRWTIDVTHPALDGPRSFRQPNEPMELALPRQTTLLVPSEPVNGQGEVVKATDQLEIVVRIQFRVLEGIVSGTSSVRPQKPDWVTNLFTFDRLRSFYAGQEHELLEAYDKILRHCYRQSMGLNNSMFLEFQNDAKYPGKKRFKDLSEFEQAGKDAQRDSDEAANMPFSTPEQRQQKEQKGQQALQALKELNTVAAAWLSWRIERIDGKITALQKTLAESLRAAKDELQTPVEIRVGDVTVEARDPADKEGKVYTVWIVKSEDDVTRAASK